MLAWKRFGCGFPWYFTFLYNKLREGLRQSIILWQAKNHSYKYAGKHPYTDITIVLMMSLKATLKPSFHKRTQRFCNCITNLIIKICIPSIVYIIRIMNSRRCYEHCYTYFVCNKGILSLTSRKQENQIAIKWYLRLL